METRVKSLTIRFLVLILVPMLVGTVVVFIISVRMMRNAFEQSYQNRAESIVQTLDSGIGSLEDLRDKATIQKQIYKLLYINPEIVRIQIHLPDENGRLISYVSNDTTREGEPAEDHCTMAFQENRIVNFDQGVGQSAIYISALPIVVSGQRVGVYEIALSYSASYAAYTSQIIYFVVGSLILFSSMILMIWYMTYKKIVMPLQKLVVGAQKIGAGDLAYRVKVESEDEIGKLAEVTNLAAQDLQASHTSLENKVEEVLNEKAKLEAIINSITRSLIVVDGQGKVIQHNQPTLSMFGLKEKDVTLEKIQAKLGIAIKLKEFIELSQKRHKSVKSAPMLWGARYVTIHATPVVVETTVLGTAIFIKDVTEEVALARSRDEFFSIASHELRTPLTAIMGNTSMIQSYYQKELKDPQLLEMISDINESSTRLINIVNDFLNMGRLEQGKLTFENKEFVIEDLIREAIKQYEVTGSRRRLLLKFDNPKKVRTTVLGDPERTRQILVNLLGNGIKYTEQGGVTIRVLVENKMAKIFVKDTGRGIAKKNQGLLFHKFQQAGDSLLTRDPSKSTGLGLYIAMLLVEGMGGKIWLEWSEENKGSEFGFSLPLFSKRRKT